MLEKYAATLEKEVDQRTKELIEEKKKSDVLLARMLPPLAANIIIISLLFTINFLKLLLSIYRITLLFNQGYTSIYKIQTNLPLMYLDV